MHCCDLYEQGAHIYLDWTCPERTLARRCQNQAEKHPHIAMLLAVIASTILGALKVISFPLLNLSCIVLIPGLCLVKCLSTKSFSHIKNYTIAWLTSLLVSIVIISFLFISIVISPKIVFLMLGILGAIAPSSTLLHIHHELFPLRSQIQE